MDSLENLQEVDVKQCFILVIDDSEDTRKLFSLGALSRGYRVTVCQSGKEGLKEIKDSTKHYDVVFLDLVLSGEDGMKILDEIKAVQPKSGVVMITGYGNVDSAVTAMQKGADDYLQKPIDLDKIVSSIENAVRLRRLKDRVQDIIAQIGKIAEIENVLKVLLKSCIDLFKGDRGSIFIFDDHKVIEEGKTRKVEVSLVGFWNHEWSLIHLGTMESLSALCRISVRERDTFYAENLSSQEPNNIYYKFFKEKVESVIATGIFTDGQLLGVMSIASDQKNAFTKDQLSALTLIGRQISPYLILSRQRTMDRKINELNRFLNDLDVSSNEFLASFTQKVVDVLSCEACSLYILDQNKRYTVKAMTSKTDRVDTESLVMIESVRNYFLYWVVKESKLLRLNHRWQFEEFIKKNPGISMTYDDKNFPYSQFLGMPVILEGKCIGVIEVAQYKLNKTFTGEDEKLLQTISFSLGRAIKSQILYQEAQERAESMSALNKINEALNRLDDPGEMLNFILQTAIEQVQARSGSIFTQANPMEGYDLIRNGELKEEFIHEEIYILRVTTEKLTKGCGVAHYRKGEGLTGQVAAKGEPINIPNLKACSQSLGKYDLPGGSAVHFLGVPLKVGNKMFGVIKLLDKQTREGKLDSCGFSERDINLLTAFANQAVLALKRGELNKLSQESINRVYTLYRMTNVFQEYTNRDIILFLTLTGLTIADGLGFNRALLMMADLTAGVLIGKMGVGPKDAADAHKIWTRLKEKKYTFDNAIGSFKDAMVTEHPMLKNCCFPLNENIDQLPGCVYHQKKAYNVDLKKTPIPIIKNFQEIVKTEAFALVPLMTKDKVYGVIYVDNKFTARPITNTDIQLLSIFANQAAVAIRIHELYQNLSKKEVEEKQLRIKTLELAFVSVSHRLRNVLPVISDRIALVLTSQASDDQEAQNWLKQSLSYTLKAQDIVRDYLEFAENKDFECSDQITGSELIKQVKKLLQENIRQANGKIEIANLSELSSVKIKINKDRLTDDFIEFLRNSEKYKPSQLQIIISGMMASDTDIAQAELLHGSYFKLTYTDNGPGISAEMRPHLFQPLVSKTKSFGLGLAIAKFHAKKHGGDLIECGRPGAGVCLQLFLPVEGS